MLRIFLASLLLISIACTATGQNVIIVNERMNILYSGIDNPIDFASKTIPQKDIILTTQNGKIIKSDLYPSYSYRNCSDKGGIVVIYAQNKRTKKIIDSVMFRLKMLPDPFITIYALNKPHYEYKGQDLVKDFTGVRSFYNGEIAHGPCLVIGYTITITDTSGIQRNMVVNNAMVPDTIRNELAAIAVSATVTVHDFRVMIACIPEPRLVKSEIKLR